MSARTRQREQSGAIAGCAGRLASLRENGAARVRMRRVSVSGLIYGIRTGSRLSERGRMCLYGNTGGLNPSASVLRLSFQAGFSPRTDTRAFIHIYNPNTHTHTRTIKPWWITAGGITVRISVVSLGSSPLLSLPSLVNSPTWPRLPIPSF